MSAAPFSLDEIRDQIRSDPTQLARIGRPGAPRRQSLQSALEWGHRLLTPEEQRVHHRLAALPGPFSLDAAAAVVGLSPVETSDLLPRLVNRSLLITNGLTQDLAEFRAGHERVYPTAITYRLEYDEDSWVESGDRLAARLWPTRSANGPRRTITR